jgi:hypothetical protein
MLLIAGEEALKLRLKGQGRIDIRNGMTYQPVRLRSSTPNLLSVRAGVDGTGGGVVADCLCLVSAISADAT